MKLLHCQIVCMHATVFPNSHELKHVNIEVWTDVEQTLIWNKYFQVVLVQALQKSC